MKEDNPENKINNSKEREMIKYEPLTKEEQKEMKRRCGQLNLLVTHTRTDVAFDLAELSGRKLRILQTDQ